MVMSSDSDVNDSVKASVRSAGRAPGPADAALAACAAQQDAPALTA